MTSVPLGVGAYDRRYGREPEVEVFNRFFEQTPTNQIEKSVLLARPGNLPLTGTPSGPVRWLGSQQGAFNNDLFYVDGIRLNRYNEEDGVTAIAGTIVSGSVPSATFVAASDAPCGAPSRLFIADGETLQFYDGPARAGSNLTVTTNPATIDVVLISEVYFTWIDGNVDGDTPDGTIARPWRVEQGADIEESLRNFRDGINGTGLRGVTYSTGFPTNLGLCAQEPSASSIRITVQERGPEGNGTVTTSTGPDVSWDNPTMTGGGEHRLEGVTVPDDEPVVALAELNSFVILVIGNSQRFYWIRPSEIRIDGLDFAEAESEPDELLSVMRIGDALYMLGQSSTEVWYANTSTAIDAPTFLRQQGLAFSQGTLPGTAARLRNRLVVIAEDGIVYQIAGGPTRISTSGVEERIRTARARLLQGE